MDNLKRAAKLMGHAGGVKKSKAKAISARRNGRLGGNCGFICPACGAGRFMTVQKINRVRLIVACRKCGREFTCR